MDDDAADDYDREGDVLDNSSSSGSTKQDSPMAINPPPKSTYPKEEHVAEEVDYGSEIPDAERLYPSGMVLQFTL